MNRRRLIRIAAVVCVAAVVTGAAGYWMATDVAPESRSGYCAAMPDAAGLYAGNPVTQMGFTVGRVDKVEPKGDHVEVTFALDPGRRYPADVKAVTRSKSLLADRSLELVGNYREGPQLTAGRCISLAHSFTPKSISQIAGSAADFIEAVSPADGGQSFRTAVAGVDQALRGQGENAREMMLHAAAAAANPDQLIADLGASILNMAPLTEDALANWTRLRSIMDQMPPVIGAGIDLWPSVEQVARGVGWIAATLYDIQRNYGADIWPFMKGNVADVIRLAATRSEDIRALLEAIPSVAVVLRQQSDNAGALTMAYQPPTVDLGTGAPVPVVGLLDLVLAKGK